MKKDAIVSISWDLYSTNTMKGWGRKGIEGDIGKRGRQRQEDVQNMKIHTMEGIYLSFTVIDQCSVKLGPL